MLRNAVSLCLLAACLATALVAVIPAPGALAATTAQPNDYNADAAWLCRPGRQDACSAPITTTVAPAEGASSTETLAPAADPPIDCFYVYPTVSREPTPNADMTAGPEEINAAQAQFAAFKSVCRLYAPLYRQTTLATLQPGAPIGDRVLAYDDVRDAFENYMARDNHGRGVVLIGHSQGSMLLTGLIQNEIDGEPAEELLVSALLAGTVIGVPTGQEVGATFQHVPLCRAMDQLGCVVAFSTFLADNPPTDAGYFGKSPAPDVSAACTNPAALGGGKTTLGAEMPVTPKVAADLDIHTTFIRLPGLVSGECVTSGDLSYLAIEVGTDRRSVLETRALTAAEVVPGWGLHLLDVNLVLDDLVELVRAQSVAWVAAHPVH